MKRITASLRYKPHKQQASRGEMKYHVGCNGRPACSDPCQGQGIIRIRNTKHNHDTAQQGERGCPWEWREGDLFHQMAVMPTSGERSSNVCRKEGQKFCVLVQRHSRCRVMCSRAVQLSVEAREEKRACSLKSRHMEVRMLGSHQEAPIWDAVSLCRRAFQGLCGRM